MIHRAGHPAIVSIPHLHDRLRDATLRVVDASWHLPGAGRDAMSDYLEGHIPGAVFFDIDKIADLECGLPHMLPGAAQFATSVGELGIAADHDVVVYDSDGLFSAARAWWTFRCFGHETVSVLDGGLPKWISQGLALEAGAAAPAPARYRPGRRADLVWTKSQVLDNLVSESAQVIDARSPARFYAREPEPRAGLRGGHIPRSINIPYQRLLAEDATLLPAGALKSLFGACGVDLKRPIVATCGSGITACLLALGLHVAGAEAVAVYDGSWAEWGSSNDTPIEKL